MNHKYDSIEEKVVQSLLELQKKQNAINDTSTDWTRAIKNKIAQVGNELNYEVYASLCDFAKDGEWLFDLTWADIKDEYLRSIPLALESEWIPGHVIDDFCKLLVSRAEHRVMVFWASNKTSADNKVKELIDEVENSNITKSGDRYLFACWIDDADKFDFRPYVAP
jgi:hypothetical protein